MKHRNRKGPNHKWTKQELEKMRIVSNNGALSMQDIAAEMGFAGKDIYGTLKRNKIPYKVMTKMETVENARRCKEGSGPDYDPWQEDLKRLSRFTGKILNGNELYHQWEGGNKPTPTPDKYDLDLTILKVNTGNILVK